MKGIYTGYYQFDSEVANRLRKHGKTNFIIEITNGDENHFLGIVRDDLDTGGMVGVGNIVGRKVGNTITFTKEMPMYTYWSLDSNTKEHKLVIDKNKKHPLIYYSGIEYEKDKYGGKWKINYGIILSLIAFLKGLKTNGTWEMRME
jgi:hypothetical protein